MPASLEQNMIDVDLHPDFATQNAPAPMTWESAAPAELLCIQRILARYVQVNNIQLRLGEMAVRAEQVFQPECLMPIVALEADRIWQMLPFKTIRTLSEQEAGTVGATYEQDQNSYFSYSAHPPQISEDVSSTLRLLTFVLAARRVLGLKENQHIDLMPYITKWSEIDWEHAVENGQLPDIPVPESFDLNFQIAEFTAMGVAAQTPLDDKPAPSIQK